jgi:lysine 2,3-aminomutase
LENIKEVINLTPEEEKGIRLAVENDVPFGITPHYLHLMDFEPNGDDYAVRRQVMPPVSYVENMIAHKDDKELVFDFMREHDTSPEVLITRRYPNVAIIKPYDSCPQICVYCQRNWEITPPLMESALATKERLDTALNWFSEHEQMMDVLVTGGDPLVMDDNKVEYILKRLSESPHIRSIRIATRIPITVPQRITEKLCEILGNYIEVGKRTICMVTHFSHPYEITLETAKAIQRVKKQGLQVYNQQVFSFANSRRFETVALRMAIKQIGVDPYYTFNMKGKSEIEDYAVPVARILQERKEEARLLPGIFRSDEPVFNVPFLGKNHLRAWEDHELISILPDGSRVYSFHPWEKNINRVKPYLYADVPIKGYLEKLKKRKENVNDYRSIWYYY